MARMIPNIFNKCFLLRLVDDTAAFFVNPLANAFHKVQGCVGLGRNAPLKLFEGSAHGFVLGMLHKENNVFEVGSTTVIGPKETLAIAPKIIEMFIHGCLIGLSGVLVRLGTHKTIINHVAKVRRVDG